MHTPSQRVRDAIDQLVDTDRQIADLQSLRKALVTTIEDAALEAPDHEPLTEADREGRQVLLLGNTYVLPVIFESDLVMASIPEGGKSHSELIAAAGLHGHHLQRLWVPSSKLERAAKDGQLYRKMLRDLFPPLTAAAVLQASLQRDKTGLPKSRTVIATDRATAATA